ncbi:carboxylate/amino acid/amine transporter [Aquisalimonas asiatica]|uniref:Carboxylate/amino acid/amine transporter n=1 Tax=Aquisalimonas asiatica TaxID=406100 RepID=A0A1H8QWX3_9GAMM|nr:carboxylate/amino acid/amine transporter [Aquisalimonas asiatica]SEO58364.1 carboxylate/amino acid/amine transporter [Aquisalimonas asiatica]
MAYLVGITVLWAFSFSLIGEYLSGQVDNDFAVLTRVLLAGLLFLPLLRWRGLPAPLMGGLVLVGMLQFGVTYLCLYRSFAYLTVPEVLLFTITTPIYVALIDDALYRRFSPAALAAAVMAVIGAAVIRYDGVTGSFITGLVLLQVANMAFAAGQVGYKHLTRRYPVTVPAYRYFGFFFVGGALVSIPSFLLFGDTGMLPETAWQWAVLGWLGLVATGLGLFLWNRGACKVDAGTLAVMNNAMIPAGLLVNLLIWDQDADLARLALGGTIMAASLWFNARFSRHAALGLRPESR